MEPFALEEPVQFDGPAEWSNPGVAKPGGWGAECTKPTEFAIASYFLSQISIAARKFRREDSQLKLSFAKPFVFASEFLRATLNSQLFV